jgi:hypothetical protein
MEPQATLDNIYWTNSEAGVTFVSSDTIYGPVFSNDDFNICGTPTFTDTVESANSEGLPGPPTTNYWQTSPGCGVATNPNFEDGVPTLAPNGAENMITNGTGPDSAPAQALGCQINGDSTFTLSGTQLSWTGGTLGTSGNPAGACGANAATGAGDGPITFASLKAPLFYVNGTITINGNATVDGFLTLVAASTATGNNDITIDGSITYPCTTPGHDITWTAGTCASPKGEGSDTQDALGLIASGNVNVSDNNAPTTINAAMIAINGSFKNAAAYITCPNYSGGGGPAGNPYNCPTLTIFGSIAQNTRGVVGYFDPSSGSIYQGYSKAYFYDTSLNTLWPPFFIPPANSTWTPRSYTELASGVANEAVPGT